MDSPCCLLLHFFLTLWSSIGSQSSLDFFLFFSLSETLIVDPFIKDGSRSIASEKYVVDD
jgi:hypothetical protein